MHFETVALQIEMPECEMCFSPKEGAMKMMENLIWRKTSVYIAALCVLHPKYSPSPCRHPEGFFQKRLPFQCDCSKCNPLCLIWCNKNCEFKTFILVTFAVLVQGMSAGCGVFPPHGPVFTWFHFQHLNQSIDPRRKARQRCFDSSWNTSRSLFYPCDWPLQSLSFDIGCLCSQQRLCAVHLDAELDGRPFILYAPGTSQFSCFCTPNSPSAWQIQKTDKNPFSIVCLHTLQEKNKPARWQREVG